MSVISKATLILILFASVTSHAHGQGKIEELETEIALEWNRLQDHVGNVRNAISAGDGLELSEKQQVEFQKFLNEHELLKLSLSNSMMLKDPRDRLAGLIAIQTQVDVLTNRLDEDILLPHQVKFLKIKEFSRFLVTHNGDLIKVMKSVFGEDLELTKVQRETIDDARNLKAKEIEDARRKFAETMRAIDLKYRKSISDCLSTEQKAKIEKHSQHPLVPSS